MDKQQVVTTPYWLEQTAPLFVVQHHPESGVINKTAVIILNSGFLHNVGPYRMNIDIANLLSSLGFVVARVDQSGKGDSPPRHDSVGISAKLTDYDELFEHLRGNFGVTDCVLIGLCSGADDGLEIAQKRDSVSGLIFLDGFCPVTFWYYAYHYYKRIRYFRYWLQWKKKHRGAKQAKTGFQSGDISFSSSNETYNTGLSLRRWQSEGNVKTMYESVLKRGVKIMAVFSGSAGDYYNHLGQLRRGVQASTVNLHEIYFCKAAHIYSDFYDRNQLVKSIGNWVQLEFSKNE